MAETPNPEQLKDKLQRALKAKAVLQEKSKLLERQADDARRREDNQTHVVSELLDRQRETNYMLHSANSVLHRLQETNLALSSEFTELVKELPAPNSPDWEQRVAKINELFKKTGDLADEIHNEVFRSNKPEEPARLVTSNGPAPAAASVSEPIHVAETVAPTPDPEPAEAVIVPETQGAQEEYAAEHVAPQPTMDAEYTTEEAERQQRLERLFRRLDTVDADARRSKATTTQTQPTRTNFIGRFWGKVTGQGASDDSTIDKAS